MKISLDVIKNRLIKVYFNLNEYSYNKLIIQKGSFKFVILLLGDSIEKNDISRW